MFLVDILKYLLELFYNITANYGLSIILLSLTVTILMLPLFWIAEKLQNRERARKARMQPALDRLKDVTNKQEKYYYTRRVYKQYSYSPIYSLTGILGLLIQVPFFVAAYWMLLEYTPLEGVSYGPINNLFQPDGIISIGGMEINLLPFVMTFINLFAGYLYAKNMGKSEQIQLIVLAFVFFVLLYNMSAALVLYWTMNNVFAVGKNWLINNTINSRVGKKLSKSRVTKLYNIALSQFKKIRNQIIQIPPNGKTKRLLIKFKGVRYYLALLALPYLSVVCENVSTLFIALLLLFSLVILDIIFAKGKYVWKHIYLIILIILFIFLYSLMIKESIEFLYSKYDLYSLNIHLRHIYLVLIPILFAIYYTSNHKIIYSLFSIFVITLSMTLLIMPIINSITLPKYEPLIRNNVFAKQESNYNRKTAILLIFDGYASPEEIGKLNPKQNSEELINYLEPKNNWVIKREFQSLEANTLNSVPSLFNYNLSDTLNSISYDPGISKERTFSARTKGTSKLMSDLEFKNVSIKNYSMLNVKGVNEDDPLKLRWYENPKEKYEKIKSFVPFKKHLENSATFYKISQKTLFSEIMVDDLTYTDQAQTLNRTLFSVLNEEEFKKYDFLVYHFLMPHVPYLYYDEFILESGAPDSQYVKYWQFTNKKIISFLDSFNNDNYRIIITGDHGYRKSSKVDQLNTFGAFYGFNQEDVDKVRYVQDIGSLINHIF
jgi:YidC/Oxa1 family membrane protein insertase